MSDNAPTIVPEDKLPAEVRALTREQRLSKARNAAQSGILKKYRKEFDAEMAWQAAALGVEWAPRAATAEEKALEQVEAILEKYPSLAKQIVGLVLDDDEDVLRLTEVTSGTAGEPHPGLTPEEEAELAALREQPKAGEISRPTKAWVAGALREGRVTLDEPYTFVYSVGGEMRRAVVDDDTVKLVADGD